MPVTLSISATFAPRCRFFYLFYFEDPIILVPRMVGIQCTGFIVLFVGALLLRDGQ